MVAESSEPGGYFTLLLAGLSRLCQVRWPESSNLVSSENHQEPFRC